MIAIRKKLRIICTDTRGATAIEYGLICSLIVVAMIGALTGLGGGVGGKWNNLASEISNVM